jgi:hypothetical protein
MLAIGALAGCARSPTESVSNLAEASTETSDSGDAERAELPTADAHLGDAGTVDEASVRDASEDAAGKDVKRRLRLEVGAPEVEGPIADAERQLAVMKPAFRTCYDLWGRGTDVLTMQVGVTLDSKGKVEASGVKAKEPLPRDLRDCIQSVVKRTRFQLRDAKPARLSFSLAFER